MDFANLALSSHNILYLLTLIAFTRFLIKLAYNLFFSPLSAIPGPWYYATSDLWLTLHVVRLRQCKAIQELFEIYGPVVRVGPNKVVFRDTSTMRNVYSVHKFDKSDYYKSLLTNDNDHAMTTLDHPTHAIRRKTYAPHYIPCNISRFQPDMQQSMMELVHTLENISGKRAVECLMLFRHLMVDVMVSSTFGYRLGALGKWTMGREEPLSTAINDFPKRGILRSIVPTWAWNLVCRIPNNRWRQLCDSDAILAEFVSSRVYEMRANENGEKAAEAERVPLLQRMLHHRYSPSLPMPDHDIISECIGHLMAGTDTTSTSLAFFCWELTRRPDIMKKLQAELDDVMPDTKTLPDTNVLQELPYLSAFIKEGLRLYTAAPSILERVVPAAKNGTSDGMFDLMGYAVPEGTIVGTQAWSMHRDPSAFQSPNTFLPERWLLGPNTSPEDLSHMMASMVPFGTGSRVCGGQNLALMMLRFAVAAFVRNFDISVPDDTTESSMNIRDSFVIFPAAMECKLIFTPRQG